MAQELVQKNAQLVAVTRQLGADAERDKAALRAELEGEAAHRTHRLAHQLAQQRSEREAQEVRSSTESHAWLTCQAMRFSSFLFCFVSSLDHLQACHSAEEL